jgi:hypothetical protein|tara:strand:- start:688 stop:855 length:168 start_codon:yes stop_codon:yes gene_type:complete
VQTSASYFSNTAFTQIRGLILLKCEREHWCERIERSRESGAKVFLVLNRTSTTVV